MQHDRSAGEDGFTLIEVVLVIIIVAILAAAIGIGADSIGRSKRSGAVRRLVSDLRFAQQVAITKQIRHGAVFTANTYTIFENDDTADPARNPQGGGDFVVDLTSGDFAGVTIATDLTDAVIRFESSGRPLEGMVPVPLATPRQVIFTLNGSSTTVTITPETGKIDF